MKVNLNAVPSLIAFAIIVVVFWNISRQKTGEPLRLWLTGWILVFTHFVAQFVDTGQGLWDHIASAVSLNALELASIADRCPTSAPASRLVPGCTRLARLWGYPRVSERRHL
jgi:hypothetical protein